MKRLVSFFFNILTLKRSIDTNKHVKEEVLFLAILSEISQRLPLDQEEKSWSTKPNETINSPNYQKDK